MTESTRLFRAGIFAGLLLSTAAVSVAQQGQAPSAMPVPRYQSPAVPQSAPAAATCRSTRIPQSVCHHAERHRRGGRDRPRE
jgi:peptidyl-prolyl cis-trans isomerase SurA